MNAHSCIDIYGHSCLKPFSIGRKPCSNSKTHDQIMKFTCRLNMGFGRRHWSMRRDVMYFVETNWPPRFSVSFYVVNVISENARIAINHGLFQCSNIRWITRKGFEHAACGLVFKHLPRDPSNV